MSDFDFDPAPFVPFRDKEVLSRVRSITRDELAVHPNPELKIRIVRDSSVGFIQFTDTIARIIHANETNSDIALIMGNPNPGYRDLAAMLNRLRVDCRRLHIFNMDEWADQDGRIAPETYPQGFMHAMKKYFYWELDADLRPKESQINGPTNENINDYSKMLADFGGADACYSGTGWSGHIAFIDPNVPEFDLPLDQWKQKGTSMVTLSPYTILQNSLHGSFGRCGDTAAVPPRAATIGPADVIGAKYRMDRSAITIGGGNTSSWQRLLIRLMLHGPVTPLVPASILQSVPTDYIIAESVAANVEPVLDAGY